LTTSYANERDREVIVKEPTPAPIATGCATPDITMQAMPDSRQQSFEEIYGPPENFLEIEVCLSQFSLSPHLSKPNEHQH